jgi:protein-disulfide isomerase
MCSTVRNPEQKESSDMNRRTALAALMCSAALAAAPAFAQETTTAETAALPEVKDYSIGDENAKVKIVEYASFTCPHCAAFHAAVFKELKRDYIDTGKVHFTYREVYFDKFGLWAAMVARCGGDTRYFGIADRLFETQNEWLAGGDTPVAVENLKKIGLTAGMDESTIQACLDDQKMAEAMVARFQTNMTADGVEGTPTLFINGEKHGNMAYADLKAIIDPLLAE